MEKDLLAAMAKSKTDKVWDIATKLAVPFVLTSLAFVYGLDRRVLFIENTRLTNTEIMRSFADYDRKIAEALNLASRGPEWLRSDMAVLGNKLDSLKSDVSKVSDRVIKLESK